MEALEKMSFSEALLASLKQQRSSLLGNGQKPLCDVILKCGNIATRSHSSVLASVSKYFERILTERHSNTQGLTPSSLVSIDVAKLFRGIETLFPIVIDSLYSGVQVVSPQDVTNNLLNSVYNTLELQIPFSTPEIEPATTTIIVTNTNLNNFTKEQQNNPQLIRSNHIEIESAEASMNFSICPQCNMLFVSEEEFIAHTKQKCARKLTCYTCGKLFTRVQGLALHLTEVRHGETVCSICGYEGESQKDAEMHIGKHAVDQERPYFCVFCDIRFSTRKRWEKHMPKHSAEAPFDCKDCGKAFKWKHALTAHSVIHAPVKKFLCQECGFSTSHVSTFRFHNRIHSGNLTKCDVKNCTFQTTRKSNLVQHRLTHSKEKPHQCEICGRAFSLAKNMRRHARQHDTNATIFNCNITNCSFKTLRSDKYIEHVKKYHPTEEQNATENQLNHHQNTILNHTTTPIMVKTENNLLLSSTTINNPTLLTTKTEKNTTIKSEMELRLHETTTANITNIKTTRSSSPTLVQNNTNNFTNKTTTTTISIGTTSGQVQTCLLTSSPFNTVSPPNKTVSDTYVDAMNLDPHLDEGHFDEALMLAAANATEEDITNLVTPLLS